MDLEIDAPADPGRDLLARNPHRARRLRHGPFIACHLRDFPLHEIKIDRSFITQILDSPSDRAVIRAVLAIAKEFRATVVVEGIELEEQRQAVLVMDDDVIAQGFPLCAADARRRP